MTDDEKQLPIKMNRQRSDQDQRDIERLAELFLSSSEVNLHLNPPQTALLIGLIHLALRHPENRGLAATFGRHIVEELMKAFPAEAQAIIRRGDDPKYDVPATDPTEPNE